VIRSDLTYLRNVYNLDIREASARRLGFCCWRYLPR